MHLLKKVTKKIFKKYINLKRQPLQSLKQTNNKKDDSSHLARIATLAEWASRVLIQDEAVVAAKTTQHLAAGQSLSNAIAHHELAG